MGWQGKPHEPSRAHLVAEVDRLRDALAEAQDVAERLAVQVDRLEQALAVEGTEPPRPLRRPRRARRG